MTDDVENPTSAQPSWLDDTLRAALTHLPEESATTSSLPQTMLGEIDSAIDEGWPQGRPPTVEELAADTDTGDTRDGHRPTEPDPEHDWPDRDHEVTHPSHLHSSHHDDHPSHIDPDHGPHL